MNHFQTMLSRTTASVHHGKMLRFAQPLRDHFNINHFWYYRITDNGLYSYAGTHQAWSEYCFDNSMLNHFTCLRHPDLVPKGITLMKSAANHDYGKVLETAWEKFRINFNINLVARTSDGVEAFGFATSFNDPHADERLINHLPLLQVFIKSFKSSQKSLLDVLENNQVDLSAQFGQQYYESPKSVSLPFERNKFLKAMGFERYLSLTPREKSILKFISSGYPASYIAGELQLSKKTVENYLANIKCKLACATKTQLINKTKDIAAAGYFDFQN